MPIQIFHDINTANAATGYSGRTDLPTFYIFRIEDTYPETRRIMTSYSFSFYQVALLENSADAALHMNTSPVADLNDTITFASPDHVLAWMRGEAQRGYIVYFKEEFLAHYPTHVQHEFPFFRLTEINMVRVNDNNKPTMLDDFARLLSAFHSTHPYRVQILQALLLVLLFDCKWLYELQEQTMRQISAKQALTFRFQQFVNQYFLIRKTVDSYAELLSVSPDYLRQSLRYVTGRMAHDLIADRVLLEAKKLLLYSDLSIGEIADYLGYTEPSHFGRFFRNRVGISPFAWRQQNKQTYLGNGSVFLEQWLTANGPQEL